MSEVLIPVEFRHFHLCSGSGSGAAGFNDGSARLGNLVVTPRCIGGIDVDPAACIDFAEATGAKPTCLDLFDEQQYRAFHDKAPPRGWRAAYPDDIRKAQGYEHPHVAFASFPCKGFSGLLSEKASLSPKYQALNAMTERGIMLLLEANSDDPIEIILFENVPRIATRGRAFIDSIKKMLAAYDYAVAETEHDCGELGNLGQSRKRFLMVARYRPKVPNFLYEPVKYPLRGVGEVLDRLPMPLSGLGGPLHRMPALQWKTWVRLALVEAGSDWRSLNKLDVENGFLRDFAIAPDYGLRGTLGVQRWEEPACVIKGRSLPTNGAHAVADPRPDQQWAASVLGVNQWDETGATVTGRMAPGGGAHAVADPRARHLYQGKGKYRVTSFAEHSGVVIAASTTGQGAFAVADPRFDGQPRRATFGVHAYADASGVIAGETFPSNGAFAVADPRVNGHPKSVQLGVRRWQQTAGVITGKMIAGGGPNAVADPRLSGVRFNHVYRVVRYGDAAPAVAGPGGPAGGLAVGDPRYTNWHPGASSSKLRVGEWEDFARSVTGSTQVASGAGAIADPRPEWGDRDHAHRHRETGGHYGVLRYDQISRAVTGHGQHDNGYNSVADPRASRSAELINSPEHNALPAADEKVVCIIRAIDGTWHRPFTTLECAALQSMFDPEKFFTAPEDYWDLHGMSDSAKRERIGNAVPRESAKGMASAIYLCLLNAMNGETFTLSSQPIWVQPVTLAIASAGAGVHNE